MPKPLKLTKLEIHFHVIQKVIEVIRNQNQNKYDILPNTFTHGCFNVEKQAQCRAPNKPIIDQRLEV